MIERYYYEDEIDSTEKNEKDSGFDLFKYKYPFDFSKDVVKKDNKAVDDNVVVPKTTPVSEKEVDMGGASGENASSKESRLDKQAKRHSIYEHRVAQAERLLSKLEQI